MNKTKEEVVKDYVNLAFWVDTALIQVPEEDPKKALKRIKDIVDSHWNNIEENYE